LRISAIIPAFNAAAHIKKAIVSALDQREAEVEVIVVDDGSTDGTWTILESFGDRIRKERQSNGGPAKARNTGARLATSEWLAFLDADDEWLPEKTVRQFTALDASTAMVYSDRFNTGNVARICERASDSERFYDGDVFEPLLLHNFITTSSVVIRKSRFEQLGGFDESPTLLGVEDWDLWLRYAADGRIALCHDALVCYRWHPDSVSNNSNNFDHLCRARLEVIRRALALPRGRRVTAAQASRAIANAWEAAAWFIAPTRRWKAFHWYLRSAYYAPFNLGSYKGMAKCCLGVK
jgi:glycosyltransferase involved in cell wall biosynthesis